MRKYQKKSKKTQYRKKNKSARSNKSKNNRTKKNHNKKNNQNNQNKQNKNSMKNMKGGFVDCRSASIVEPSFELAGLGNISGLSIPEAKAAIFKTSCKKDLNHPMA